MKRGRMSTHYSYSHHNPAFTLPDGGDFYQSLTKLPFIISFSPYFDETAFMADLILPDHTYLEKTDEHPMSFFDSVQFLWHDTTCY